MRKIYTHYRHLPNKETTVVFLRLKSNNPDKLEKNLPCLISTARWRPYKTRKNDHVTYCPQVVRAA